MLLANEDLATYMAVRAGGNIGAAGPGREIAREAEQGDEPQQRCAPGCNLRLLCCRLCRPREALALQLRDRHLQCRAWSKANNSVPEQSMKILPKQIVQDHPLNSMPETIVVKQEPPSPSKKTLRRERQLSCGQKPQMSQV